MANMCAHWVWFTGPAANIENLNKMLAELITEENNDPRNGKLPSFVPDDNAGWMFGITMDDDCLRYECKHGSNMEDMKIIADHFGVTFTADYEEFSNRIYGKTIYDGKELKSYAVDENEWMQIEENEDEENNTYPFRGKDYESIYDILDTLLEEAQAVDLLQVN